MTHCSRLQGFCQVNGEFSETPMFDDIDAEEFVRSTRESILFVSFTSWRTRSIWPAIIFRFSTLNFRCGQIHDILQSFHPSRLQLSQNRRTAEVTICVILERLLDRPRQLPHSVNLGIRWKSHEKSWWKVSLMSVRDQLHKRQHKSCECGSSYRKPLGDLYAHTEKGKD